MANTYDPSLSTPKDYVRYYVGDRSAPWLLTDEEITAHLAQHEDDALNTAISMLAGLIAEYSRKASSASVGPFSINYAETAEQFRKLRADLLREKQSKTPAAPYVSGVDLGQEEDGDKDNYLFSEEMHDNIYTETYEGVRSPTGWA